MAWASGARKAALAVLLLLVGCGGGADTGRLGENEPGQPAPLPPIPYEVRVAGELPPPSLRILLQSVAIARASAKGSAPATSRLTIRQRALSAQASLEQALRAQGYFDGAVSFAIVDVAEAPPAGMVGEVERLATRPEFVLRFDVVPGERYRFGALAVAVADNADGYKPPEPKALGLVQGDSAVTQTVLDAEGKLLDDARKAGFALAKLGNREAVVDHATSEMDVTLHLDAGQHAVFGQVSFTGADGISTDFLRSRVPIEPGKPYDTKRIEEGQNNLYDTDLFSTIVPRPADKLTPDKQLDVAFDLKQRAPRTIGAEINYDTDLGPGGKVFWEHRNIFGAGERFRIEASGSRDQQALTSTLTKPDFLRPQQSLLTSLSLNRDRLEAYDPVLGGGLNWRRARGAAPPQGVARNSPTLRPHPGAGREPEQEVHPAVASEARSIGTFPTTASARSRRRHGAGHHAGALCRPPRHEPCAFLKGRGPHHPLRPDPFRTEASSLAGRGLRWAP